MFAEQETRKAEAGLSSRQRAAYMHLVEERCKVRMLSLVAILAGEDCSSSCVDEEHLHWRVGSAERWEC